MATYINSEGAFLRDITNEFIEKNKMHRFMPEELGAMLLAYTNTQYDIANANGAKPKLSRRKVLVHTQVSDLIMAFHDIRKTYSEDRSDAKYGGYTFIIHPSDMSPYPSETLYGREAMEDLVRAYAPQMGKGMIKEVICRVGTYVAFE